MAEIAGLSLAANILQVVECGAQFAATAYKIYKSGNDALENFSSLQVLSKSLEEVTQRLEASTPQASASTPSGELALLSHECTKTTREMLKTLERIGLPKNVKPKKRDALQHAFKAWWNEEKIKTLQKHLDSFRSQWILHVLEMLQSNVATSSKNQEKLFQQLMQEIKIQNASQSDITRIEAMIKELVITCSIAPGSIPSVSNITLEKREFLEKKFLRQLKYDGMDLRQDTVEEAHKETFRWIFDRSDVQLGHWDNLQEWFGSPHQQLYWITGKPGAGKSTLMKLICDAVTETNPDGPCFDLGFETQDLTVATFFFWAAGGNEMQKSREGLFRTLIYQLWKQHLSLIASTAPDRWEALCLFGDDPTSFTEVELQNILRKCLRQLDQKRLLLFIDGLDEFAGRHDDLVQFFFELLDTHRSVKLCVSSRPWEVFEESFNNRPSLRIHDLTHRDMKAFLLSNMRTSPVFITSEEEESICTQELIHQVLDKAQGVFLWVRLVTRSMIEALRGGDNICQLSKMLHRLPDGSLDDLFHRILQDLEPHDLERAAHYVGLMQALVPRVSYAPEVIKLDASAHALAFSFADEEDPEFSIKLPENKLSTFQGRLSTVKKRINSSCKGLLEVIEKNSEHSLFRRPHDKTMNYIVQYPHRSIRDYLESARARAILSGRTRSNPYLKLCSAYLACFKTLFSLEEDKHLEMDASHISIWVWCLDQAARVPTEYSATMIRIVDELYRVSLPRNLPLTRCIRVCNNSPGVVENAMLQWPTSGIDHSYLIMFLSTTVVYNMIEYVKSKIAQVGGFMRQNRSSTWAYLARRVYQIRATVPSDLDLLLQVATATRRPSPRMIELLLRSGADPNSIVWPYSPEAVFSGKGFTIWEGALALIIESCSQQGFAKESHAQEAWRQIGCLMAAHGTNVDSKALKKALKWLEDY